MMDLNFKWHCSKLIIWDAPASFEMRVHNGISMSGISKTLLVLWLFKITCVECEVEYREQIRSVLLIRVHAPYPKIFVCCYRRDVDCMRIILFTM